MKHIEQKPVQINKNVVKNVLIDPNATLQENLDNQRKLKIRKGIQNLSEDGLDLYDLVADLSNAFFELLEQVEHKDTNSIVKFKERYIKINEIVRTVQTTQINKKL